MSNKKRQMVTIIGLLVLLVAAGVAYYGATVYQKEQAKKESAEDNTETTLYAMDVGKINKLHLVTDETDVTYVKKEGIWHDASDEQFPVNQDNIVEMLDDVAQVNASKLVVENPDDISQYQLDKPSYRVELEDEEGNSNTLVIGMESVAAEGYYAYVGDADKIYAIGSNVTDALNYTWGEMMELPETPDITAAYVTAFKMTPAKGDVFEAVYNEKRAVYKDYEAWDIKSPYKKVMPGSASALETLFGGLVSLSYVDGVAYHATKAQKKQYGLDKPTYTLDVSYYTLDETQGTGETDATQTEEVKTEHVFQLSVGAKDDLEENYYVSIRGEKGIYRIPADTIDGLVDIDAFETLCKTPHKANVDTLQEIVLTQGGKSHKITMTKEEVKNAISEDNSPVYNYFVKLDGKEVEDETFRTTYNNVFSELVYRGEIDGAVKAVGEEPVQSITIKTDDRNLTMKFLPYDGVNFYRIELNGDCLFLVDKNVADKVFAKLLASA
ncbi:MAG: DUF4340 domain-containing protein [Lachnospiraceae bacterium]|nr:DUF4340 domain-containing protein [Lachnospiraceae bacterium]